MADTVENAVTASEFKNHVGLYLDQAARAAVLITRYDRPSRVLIDYEEYHRLQALAKARPTRKAIRAEDLDAELVEALEGADYSHIDPKLNSLMR